MPPKAKKPAPKKGGPAQPLAVGEVRELKLDDLREPSYNINRMTAAEQQGLADSMDEFGVVEFPVVNLHEGREGVIVGGSHRVGVARGRGQTMLPCIVVDLPREKERELSLRLNKHRGTPQAELVRQFFAVDELTAVGYGAPDLASWDMLTASAAADLDKAAKSAQPPSDEPPPTGIVPAAPGPPPDVPLGDGPPPDQAKVPGAKQPPGDPGFQYKEQYAVLVMCGDEQTQKATFDKLVADGYDCKVATV